MANRAVFLDLNGTLVMPILVSDPNELRVIDGVEAAVSRLSAAGFVCPVVTIQSGIAKGRFSGEVFATWFAKFSALLARRGAHLVGPYVCPHRFKERCACKKPNTRLYAQAAQEHRIDLSCSFVIGDSAADVEAAARFGGRGILVRTGWGVSGAVVEQARGHGAHVAESLTSAVDWVLSQE